jgi:hypothetical protein
MALQVVIAELNSREDGNQIRKVLEYLRFCRGFSYKESFEYFHKHDSSIDESRFEELCQLADADLGCA